MLVLLISNRRAASHRDCGYEIFGDKNSIPPGYFSMNLVQIHIMQDVGRSGPFFLEQVSEKVHGKTECVADKQISSTRQQLIIEYY